MLDPYLPQHELRDALAVSEWARSIFPEEFAALPDPKDLKTYTLEVMETSSTVKAIAFTSFEPDCAAAEFLWPGAGEVTVLAFIRDASILACQIRSEQVIGEFELLEWLKDYGPTFMDAFASCSLSDCHRTSPVEVALEIEAIIRYFLAAKGVAHALECDDRMFKWNFARACQRQHQKLVKENNTKAFGPTLLPRISTNAPTLRNDPAKDSSSTEQCVNRLPDHSETSQEYSNVHERFRAEETGSDSRTTSHALVENEQHDDTNSDTDIAVSKRHVKKLHSLAKETEDVTDKVATLEACLSASEGRERALHNRLDADNQALRDDLAALVDSQRIQTKAQQALQDRYETLAKTHDSSMEEHESLKQDNTRLWEAIGHLALKSKNESALTNARSEWTEGHIKSAEGRIDKLETETGIQATAARVEAFDARVTTRPHDCAASLT